MSEDASLPTDMLVSAYIRIAAKDHVPIVVRRRGHNASGTIVIKINLLNGEARVLTQVRFGDELVWSPITRTDPMADGEAEKLMEQQSDIDPDSWLIEIEDRQGRHWLPGRIVTF
jgi:hypothetical protein